MDIPFIRVMRNKGTSEQEMVRMDIHGLKAVIPYAHEDRNIVEWRESPN